jgi:hypothetical protein
MKLLLTSILFIHFTVAAQPDSSHIKPIPFTYLNVSQENLCIHLNQAGVIQTDSLWKNIRKLCNADIRTKPDFSKYAIWQRTSMGDCHARFTYELFMDTLAKKIIWVENDYYGGCRAAKFVEVMIQFATPPAGYTFELREIKIPLNCGK